MSADGTTQPLPSRPAKPAKVELKTPKGTRDWSGPQLIMREHIFATISDVFKRHGGTPLDTPVFELKEILAGKYGEDSKLIYDLKDQGGEDCSLRYDLTVPFARFLAMNKVEQIKRYHIAKVYRRDNPAIARGRLREFHQCDFDIAGVYDPMIPDAEILRIIKEVFAALKLDVTIKINHRKVLDGLFAVAGVPAEKTRMISSAVDKLDKMPWADVKKEMVEEKGLAEEVADYIGEWVKHSGSLADMLELLGKAEKLVANEQVKAGLDDMALLRQYADVMEYADIVSFDLSLARGLDYYTGVIYEVIVNQPKPNGEEAEAPNKKSKKKEEDPASQVGSIAAGGRYDNLVGMYGKKQIPCVGISFGVDRIFTILEARAKKESQPPAAQLDAYIFASGDGLLLDRMKVAKQLWDAGLRAEFQAKVKPRFLNQFKAAGDTPVGVFLGPDEIKTGEVRVKRLNQGSEADKNPGTLVKREDLVKEVRKILESVE